MWSEPRRGRITGGRLLVTTPNYHSLWPVMEWIVDRSNKAPQMAGEQHISKFNPASLRRLLAEFQQEPPFREPLLHWTRLAEPVLRRGQPNATGWKLAV